MNVQVFLDNSILVEWFLTSIWGFPTFIAIHSVGMAFVVGLSFMVALRYLGIVADVSLETINVLIKIAWSGFIVNLFTGVFLFLSRITDYFFDPTFLVKMGFVTLAAIGLRFMQQDFAASDAVSSSNLRRRYIPVATIFCWVAAITAGRWIAYLSGIY